MKKIAILTDSGCGLEASEYSKSTYVIPLYINFKEKSYKDIVDISADDVYDRMLKGDIPKTSIPAIGEIKQVIESIKNAGYTDILAISISSKLSGVYNAINLALDDTDGINYKAVDTKNISLGTGFFVIYAQHLLETMDSLDEIHDELQSKIYNSKVFFNIDTLKFLVEGGRIGKVLGGIGSMLKITPVISCDKDGVYYTVSKKRNAEKALTDIIEQIKDFISKHDDCKNRYFGIIYKKDNQILTKIKTALKEEFASSNKLIIYDQVSPALGVHTGPGLIGIGTFCY